MSSLYLTVTGRAFEADDISAGQPRAGGFLTAAFDRLFGKTPAAAPGTEAGCSLVEPLALPPDWLGAPDVIGLFLSRRDDQPQERARNGS